MTTPKDNMISQIWGLKQQALTATTELTLAQSGTLFTNEGATADIEIDLPAINTLREDKFIQPFFFSPIVTNHEMLININSTVGTDRIILPDYNNNIIKPALAVKNILGDSGLYNYGSVIGLIPAKSGSWHIAHITGVWNATGYGIIDALGLRGQIPIITLRKNTTQGISYTNPITWTDVTWQTQDVKLYFTWGVGDPANITAQVSGLADIYVNLEHLVDTDGAGDSTSARILVNGSEILGGKNSTPEHPFLDSANVRRHLKLLAPNVQLSPGDIIKVQAADNATSGTMTIHDTLNTYIQIKYKR